MLLPTASSAMQKHRLHPEQTAALHEDVVIAAADVLSVFPDESSGLANEPNIGHFKLIPWETASSTLVRCVHKLVHGRNHSMYPLDVLMPVTVPVN